LAVESVHPQRPRETLLAVESVHPQQPEKHSWLLRVYTLNGREGFSWPFRVYTLKDPEKNSWQLRVYTLNNQEGFSWLSRVYILDGWGFSRPSSMCHQRPGAILPAVGGSFWLANPQNPVVFGALTPSPAGDFEFFNCNSWGSDSQTSWRVWGIDSQYLGSTGESQGVWAFGSRLTKPL
jgi:hypothetical protein